ncbi:MAG TPA: hypothetical protein VN947_25010 [Polyangia bacterium]|nr:hypothetical protein [Polyangia bacterium]
MTIDTSGWTAIGRSDNADFYELDESLLAVVPFEGTTDDATTARQSVQIQHDYLRPRGRRAGVVVFMDRILEQHSAARAVYRDAPDPAFITCYALVGGTAFGRAVGSIFIGISRPKVPTRLFATLDEARAWARSQRG